MTSLEHCVCQHIKNLVASLSQKKQFKAITTELYKIASTFGQPAEKFLLGVLIQEIDFKDSRVAMGTKDSLKVQFLSQAISTFSLQSGFLDYFSQVFPTGDVEEFFEESTRVLRLSLSVQLLLALSLGFSSTPHVSRAGLSLLKSKLREYVEAGKPQSMPAYALHAILYVLRTYGDFVTDPDSYEWAGFLMVSNSANDMMLLPLHKEEDLNYKGDNNWKNLDISLVEILEDLGPICSQSLETLKDVFKNFPQAEPQALAEVLSLICERHSEASDFESRMLCYTFSAIFEDKWDQPMRENPDRKVPISWNLDNVSKVLAESYRVDWEDVIRHLDIPRFVIRNDQAFKLLTTLYNKITKSKFPARPFLKRWKHPRGQVSFLLHSIYSTVPQEIFNYSICRDRIEIDFSVAPELRSTIDALTSMDLLRTLIELSETEFYTMILNLFLKESERLGGVLIQGLARLKVSAGQHLLNELTKLMMPKIIANQANPAVLQRIWNENPGLIIQGAIDYYEQEPTTLRLSCLMELSQEIKDSLLELASCSNHKFSVHFGLLASKKDFLHLEHWLTERIKKAKAPFVKCLLEYVQEKVIGQVEKIETALDKAYVSKEGLRIIFEKLMNAEYEGDIGTTLQQQSADMFNKLVELIPEFQECSRTSDEIDDAANHYFQQLYSGETSVHEFIKLMHRLKNSTNPNENKVFDSMIKNLLDEYGFFHKYPEKELKITAELYGSIIRYGEINPIHLFCAMKHVKESLMKQSTKLFKFGIHALELFQDVIHMWPNYCSELANMPSLQTTHPELVKKLALIAQKAKERESEQPRSPPASPYKPPPPEDFELYIQPATKDSIMFILNTISKQNLSAKINELRETLFNNNETNIPWFANYLVCKRASTQSNFHDLYIEIIKELENKAVMKAVLNETYKLIESLISSHSEISDDDRKMLNSLGSWLGKLTISNNKPIMIRCLDLKNKLREAYEYKRLIPMVPFVCEILKTCENSEIFTKQNRWIMAVLSLLNEIKNRTDKMRIASEIEILFKKLNLEANECMPSNVLEEKQPEVTPKVVRSESFNLCEQTMLLQLPELVNISSKLMDLYPEHELRHIVAVAIEKAIKEIIQPIVQRNVNIALITTKELVIKDFEFEKDAGKLQQASELVVKSLAGSLARVTAREPFRVHVYNFLSELLRAKSLSSGTIKDIAEDASRDNLDLGCDLIAKIVVKKALNDVAHEESIKHELLKRQDGSFASELSAKRSRMSTLPDFLRPRINGLTPEQLAVYMNFDRQEETRREPPPRETRERTPVSKFEEELETAERVFRAKNQLENPEVQHAIENVVRLAVASKPETLAAAVKIIFNKLYSAPEMLKLHLQVLQHLKNQNRAIVNESTNYVLMLKDTQKFQWRVTSELLRNDVIHLADFDAALARGVDKDSPSASEFALQLLRDFVLSSPILTQREIAETLAAVRRLRERKPSEDLINLCLQLGASHKLRENSPLIVEKGKVLETIELRFNEWLSMTLGPAQISIEKIPDFVKTLENTGFLSLDEKTEFFFRTLADNAISRSKIAEMETDYAPIDSFCKLCQMIIILRDPTKKIRIMQTVLSAIKSLILRAASAPRFNQRAYFRILQGILSESTQPSFSFTDMSIVYELIVPIADAFHSLNPCKVPAFSFAWLELVAHRFFLPKMLRTTSSPVHWKKLHKLLVDLFRFVGLQFWRSPLTESMRRFYEGIIRVITVILHDCPEFLCEHYLDYVELIPENCLQLKNLVLSAYPTSMRVPFPHSANLKVDLLAEMNLPANLLSDYYEKLGNVKSDIDLYFDIRDSKIIERICGKIIVPSENNPYEESIGANYKIMNSLVVYVASKVHTEQVELAASNQFFLNVLLFLSNDQRLHFINAIANHIRFPNLDTKFTSCLILHLFFSCDSLLIQEMIAKVLTERTITYRPHPWGLLITLIELIKNPKYDFFKKPFIRSTPDLENMYNKLSKNTFPDIEDSKT